MNNIFFTSDTHFGHANIIKYCKRPFASADEMNETMIENWNKTVDSLDTVYHLGDFALGVLNKADYAKAIRERLHGDIHFLMGNHDPAEWRHQRNLPRFLDVKDYDEIRVGGQKIVLFHYGMRVWHHDSKGAWHLYGHSHGALPPHGKSFDCGVDCNNFTPVSFEDIKSRMSNLEIAEHGQF